MDSGNSTDSTGLPNMESKLLPWRDSSYTNVDTEESVSPSNTDGDTEESTLRTWKMSSNTDGDTEESALLRPWKNSSIWVALDFPRVCVETFSNNNNNSSSNSPADCESMDLFSCLLENARRRLDEAITGSCKKPCCKTGDKGGGGGNGGEAGQWDATLEELRCCGEKPVDGFEPSVSYYGNVSSSIWSAAAAAAEEESVGTFGFPPPGPPPEALFYVLPFLLLKDLLSVEQVCKPLRDAVAGDTLLWRHLKVDHSLSTKITDEILLKLASRAQGRLQSLMLIKCLRISDEAVEQIVFQNPMISEIYLPGCMRMSIDSVVRMIEFLQQVGLPGVKQVKLRSVPGLTEDNLEHLQALLGVTEESQRNSKPHHYIRGDVSTSVDERILDVEICPRCRQPRAVYDCTRSKCGEWKSLNKPQCRGCIICIPRCEECGRCIDDTDYEETFCLRWLCSACWVQLPKCSECNRPGCESSADFFIRKPDAVFVCPYCQDAYKSGDGAGLEFYVV